MSHLPQWAVDAMKDAGVPSEGWNGRERSCFYTVSGVGRVWVNERAELTLECDQPEPSDAFRLAHRLAAALQNTPTEPDEAETLRARVQELEAEVGRLKDLIELHESYEEDTRMVERNGRMRYVPKVAE